LHISLKPKHWAVIWLLVLVAGLVGLGSLAIFEKLSTPWFIASLIAWDLCATFAFWAMLRHYRRKETGHA
jgi:Zn-dependent protease with chaperone function